ncbi:nuclear transport factor 2 family protein [Rhodococcus opacus]|uniref:nuclear transport factor 2 family protein n=1 Tax=Rhodococcus opacus TaxID=37919 RepID=UPI00294A8841|nr:nuclear transport factor 2 family protein [Rhodococcus opacus]MDV6247383.1 nuclear transport factor 2 family protein [Rhodococcus opacus]
MSSDPPHGPAAAESNRHTEIAQAVYRSWWNVDRAAGIGSELLYTEDGVCVMPALTMTGRDEIVRGYAARQAHGPRLSRHLVSNLVTDHHDDARVTATYALTLFARNGVAPLELDSPSAICDVVDDFVRTGGDWLIRRRVLEAVFVAQDNDSVLLGRK